jgi:hypothetical protein
MNLKKFDPPVKIPRVKSGLLEIWRVKESFQGSNGHPDRGDVATVTKF